MSELLPCPFCGGEAEMLTAESMNGGYLFGIMCNDCRSRGDVYDTEAEAIEAWNTRAETVILTGITTVTDTPQITYVSERTCHIVKASRKYVLSDGTELFEDGCSECNGYIDDGDNYCPNCGAKVVSE